MNNVVTHWIQLELILNEGFVLNEGLLSSNINNY